MTGDWWEVARDPPNGNICTKVHFAYVNKQLYIYTTYSMSTTYPWVNNTYFNNFTIDEPSSYGYNLSYYDGYTYVLPPPITFKILDTDYVNFASFCGYTNSSDNSTEFGLILSRNRYPNATDLNAWEFNDSTKFSNINNETMSAVYQDPL